MTDPVLARMFDAALPYVTGRRLVAHGLDEAALGALRRWTEDAGDEVVLSVGKTDVTGALVILLLPGMDKAPELPGLQVVETQYAFRMPDGLADDTAPPTLGADDDWPFSRLGAGVWLDVQRPKQVLGCFVIARKESA
ncbi:MAG: hypothetical protein K8I27_02595 [Planctomycetes bacterium]|nr:hypothetical protein [Planctomycetota bacterium]